MTDDLAPKPTPILEFKFEPLEDFEWWRELKDGDGNVIERQLIGQYLVGQSYNCTRKSVHDALRGKCAQWAEEGKIQIKNLAPGEEFRIVKAG